jgi:hypothetical protein
VLLKDLLRTKLHELNLFEYSGAKYRDNLVIEQRRPLLILRQDCGLEGPVPVPRHLNYRLPVLQAHGLFAVPVPAVPAVVMFLTPPVFGHFRFQRLLEQPPLENTALAEHRFLAQPFEINFVQQFIPLSSLSSLSYFTPSVLLPYFRI